MNDDTMIDISNDEASLSNDQAVDPLEKLCSWLYEKIQPALKGMVLEVGNFQILKEKFENDSLISGLSQLDLSDPEFVEHSKNLIGKIDTVISITEPDKNDAAPVRLQNAKDLLGDRGRLIMVWPARIAPFENLDGDNDKWWKCNKHKIRDSIGNENEILRFHAFSVGCVERVPNTTEQGTQRIPYFQLPFGSALYATGTYMLVIARILKSKLQIPI